MQKSTVTLRSDQETNNSSDEPLGIDMVMDVKVMSFNIRFASEDGRPHDWSKRKQGLLKLLEEHPSDFIGMQEVVPLQIDFFEDNIPQYGYTQEAVKKALMKEKPFPFSTIGIVGQ
jgi:mRNA deadenylase 3'-5' endonuclease subunit Ccr4